MSIVKFLILKNLLPFVKRQKKFKMRCFFLTISSRIDVWNAGKCSLTDSLCQLGVSAQSGWSILYHWWIKILKKIFYRLPLPKPTQPNQDQLDDPHAMLVLRKSSSLNRACPEAVPLQMFVTILILMENNIQNGNNNNNNNMEYNWPSSECIVSMSVTDNKRSNN